MKRRVIAITGGIGCGKSSVANILRAKGYDVLDCDVLAREVAERKEIVDAVANLLGADCVVDGKLNRPYIREIVFANEQLHKQYSQLFWDGIKNLLSKRIEQLGEVVFVEIAVYDAFPFNWDETWLVQSDADCRKQRVVQRDGVSAENVQSIMLRQQICNNYNSLIVNNGSLSELQEQVEKLLTVAKL